MTLPDFLRLPETPHPLAHLRFRVRCGLLTGDTAPLTINYGYGVRAFTLEAALLWAERVAESVMEEAGE